MRKRLSLLGAVVALTIAGAAAPAMAASDNHTTLPDPAAKNCAGQATAFLAQGNGGVPGPGIGNVAKQASLTVKEVKAIIAAYCDQA